MRIHPLVILLPVLVPSLAHAGPVPPEMLLLVDTSQSMQYRVGADEAPVCGKGLGTTDQKSRWVVAREAIGGSFPNYSCEPETLPLWPESAAPPKAMNGSLICIGGVSMSAGAMYSVGGASQSTVQTGSVTPNGKGPPGKMTLADDPMASGVSIPWMRFDAGAVAKQAANAGNTYDWAAATVTLQQVSGSEVVGDFYAVLVGVIGDPTKQDASVLACTAGGPTRDIISTPAKIVSGQPTVFQLTDKAVAQMAASAKSGEPWVAMAAVPMSAALDSSCAKVTGTASNSVVQWAANGSSNGPQLDVVVGMKCPVEGPPHHAVAKGTQSDGSKGLLPTGADGLLDVYGQTAKFALLAGDGLLASGNDLTGGYSFAGTFTSLWGNINTGIADPLVKGSLSVPITAADTLAPRTATAKAIQDALSALRPNGPTPLAAQLLDARDYLFSAAHRDPHFRTLAEDPVNGDPYAACRPRLVVVLSDGGANLHTGSGNGRTQAIQAAGQIYAKGVPVYVMAVGFPRETGATGPVDADLQFLHDLAAAGGTQAAHPVQSAADAVQALAPAVSAAALVGEVYTRPVYTQATGTTTEVQHSFHTLSNFDLSQPLRTRGVMEQRVFKCDSACKSAQTPTASQVCDVIDFQTRLQKRTVARRLFTQGGGNRLVVDSTQLAPEDLGIGTVGTGPQLIPMADGSCQSGSGWDLSQPDQRNAYRDHVIANLKASKGTCRQQWPLGAPARSQPAVIEPASRIPLRDPSFLSYAATPVPPAAKYSLVQPPGSAKRPTMLFAATHDGLLHAFRTDGDAKVTVQDSLVQGDEMWAWLPRFNLNRLSQMKLVTSPDASFLGGSVVGAHVMLNRAPGTVADMAQQWRAVVVVGAGEGGSGYMALDVTSPDDPQLLWEISPDRHCWRTGQVYGTVGPACANTGAFQTMGRSTAKPTLATLFYARPGEAPAEHAVAILPMGKSADESSAANYGVDGLGMAGLYVVDLGNGMLLRQFLASDFNTTGMPTVAEPAKMGRLWSEAACYPAAPGQIASRCFMGDAKGVLWRLDLSAITPDGWTMSYFFDAYNGANGLPNVQLEMASDGRAPIVSAPSLARTASGGLQIVFGTGSADDTASPSRRHLVFSVAEAQSLQPTGALAGLTAKRTWTRQLDDFERFVGPPLVFSSNAYWASYVVAQNGACNIGTARLWGGRFDRSKSTADTTKLLGAFPANPDNASLVQQSQYLETVVLGAFKPSPVDVEPVPPCRGNCAPTDAKCMATQSQGALTSARPQYQLAVQVASSAQGNGQAPKNGAQPQVGMVTKALVQPRSTAMVTGWDLLLD